MSLKTGPRVVIADDHTGIVTHAVALLQSEFEVVATAHGGVSIIDCIRRFDPDVALLDLCMPEMNGLDVVRALKTSAARTVAVIMSVYNDPELADAALAAGAIGFVAKSRLTQDLVLAMRSATQGSVFVSAFERRLRT